MAANSVLVALMEEVVESHSNETEGGIVLKNG